MSLDTLRRSLAKPKTSAQLCLLGAGAGLLAAILIIAFRLTIELIQGTFLDKPDDFTELSELHRLFLPVLAALLIAVFAALTGFKHYRLGIPYVINRIKHHYGHMPIWNSANQFFGGAVALISGFSVGREGPSVHMGATAASVLSERLHLPLNAARTLAGCGVAAGIAASFNTPLAAVIFVMEVVLREYKIHIFVPVMLASVIGAMSTQYVFGNSSELALIHITPLSFWHYPYLIICGAALGAVAFAFNQNLMLIIKTFKPISMFPRLLLAGLIAGLIGYAVPGAMGSGMSAITQAVESPHNLQLLTTILIAKLMATLFAIGLGIPGGIIGPVIGLGVIMGTLMSFFAQFIEPSVDVAGTYGVLGMAGLLAATLHAPLAALTAVMELTSNPKIIVPAMLVITTAYVTALQAFGNRSIFIQQLDFQGLPYQVSPAKEALQKVGIVAEMDENFKLLYSDDKEQIKETLSAVDSQTPLIVYDEQSGYRLAEYDLNLISEGSVSVSYIELQGLSTQATLADAFDVLKDKRSGAVYIYNQKDDKQILGLLRWDQIRHILTTRNSLL
ncbi:MULTISPECIES: chloride channel protein [Pseudoalteromonas]|uniref:chloride channel protein n=1 Tax=Pseudoalteromonas TaxID=53246 RepID=UPI00029A9EA3|nr:MULTISPECIES: chloride channel protein [Pseudoalteromonas]AUJ70985.1 H(+)/Cl(-) exchange transporter ClcA [Pseudoalteromonas sp. NC201]MCF2825141.1 chloride channel protein [Pseudoalteromonas sp. OF5H-5]MCF2833462.1 chloride channel protein [Pseudoalteromonas sp. DL2-H6]MCF2925619.1 chloride channel protein [Pseudoalteromonas sp. DL2-H1]MCF7512245.1 chloride channel protein [Pseudoalteromonas sp. L7]